MTLNPPRGWDASHPHGCWLDEKESHGDSSPSTRWFNTEAEALTHAATLDWWLVSRPFDLDLWRVEEMDGYR